MAGFFYFYTSGDFRTFITQPLQRMSFLPILLCLNLNFFSQNTPSYFAQKASFANVNTASSRFSQNPSKDTLVRYFNAQFEPCKKKDFVFIGVVIRDMDGWNGIIYDDSTRVLMRGKYLHEDCLVKNGWFVYYFPNGKRALGGKFENNIRQGVWMRWYISGQIRDSLEFRNNLANGPSMGWYENGLIESSGIYTNGNYDHVWLFYHDNGKPATREKYVAGKLSELECFDTLGNLKGVNCALLRAPEIKGRYGGINKYLEDSLAYPDEARKKQVKGIVQIAFTITKTGTVKDVMILSSPHKILSDEVLRVLNSAPGWYPAVSHNRVMEYTYKLSIPFMVDPLPMIDNNDSFRYLEPYFGDDN